MGGNAPLIAVFGSSTAKEGDSGYRLAYELGRELSRAGASVMTGGYSGAMEACSKGAREHGGHVVGVTVDLFESRSPMNPWVVERVHTAQLYARLEHMIERASGFVVLPGSIGTLTELFLAWTLVSVGGRAHAPLILLGDHWNEFLTALSYDGGVPARLFEFVQVAPTPADAARLAIPV